MTSFESGPLWEPSSSRDPLPPSLPNLKVIRQLGVGGFGAVWLCEQSAPLKREVAVKVMRSVTAGPRLRARFDAERRLLARMEHPGVARIFDAGETAEGAMYFVMEFVRGERLLDYCDGHTIDVRGRVELMRQVCAAVQHAHSKGIVHLDLKPANILVCEVDGVPSVKVIDFGIARLADDPDAVSALIDAHSVAVGTIEFMAPEQLLGTVQPDTRSDVYALGVVLYELLSGLRPFDSKQLRSMSGADVQRLIRELDPDAPSVRTDRASVVESAQAETRAEARGLSPRSLVRSLRGELDVVVMHCLERAPESRYPTCDALSADLGRWLSHEPVAARAAPLGVRLAKFARRNRVGIAAAAMIVIALFGGLAAMAYGLVEANRQLARAERLGGFNTRMLESVSPDLAKGMDTRLLRLLFDQTMGSIDTEYADDAMLAADAHETAGVAYKSIGDYDKALEHIKRCYALYQTELAPEDPDFLQARNDCGVLLLMTGKTEEAAILLESTYEDRRRLFGPQDRNTLSSLHNLAWLREEQHNPTEALALYAQAAEHKRTVLGVDDPSTLQSFDNLGELQRESGQFEAALATLTDVVQRRTRISGPRASDTLLSRNNHCMVLRSMGDTTTTEPAFRALIADMEAVLGPDHPYTLVTSNNLASILRDTGRAGDAEQIYRQIIPLFEGRYGPDATYTTIAMANLALALEIQDKDAEAESLYLEVIERKSRQAGPKAATTIHTMLNLGSLYFGQSRCDEAHAIWSKAQGAAKETLEPTHPTACRASIYTAQSHLRNRDFKGALELVRQAAPDDIGKLPKDLQVIAYRVTGAAAAEAGDFAHGMKALSLAYERATELGKPEQARDIARLLGSYATDAGDEESAAVWSDRARASP